jgi:rare lipoprotein A
MRDFFLASIFLFVACRTPVVSTPETQIVPVASSPVTQVASPETQPETQNVPKTLPSQSFTEEGFAAYYADSLQGKKTASGEPYDKAAMTCAHKKLPFGTYLLVESLTNGKSVTVRVNDRGPFSESRIIDVSRVAAEQLELIRPGKMKVRITVVSGQGSGNTPRQ